MTEEEVDFIESAGRGDFENVLKYLEYNIDIDCQDCYGSTALIEAIIHDNIDMINFLLDKGADINREGEDDYTPLDEACAYRNKKIIKLLIKRGSVLPNKFVWFLPDKSQMFVRRVVIMIMLLINNK